MTHSFFSHETHFTRFEVELGFARIGIPTEAGMRHFRRIEDLSTEVDLIGLGLSVPELCLLQFVKLPEFWKLESQFLVLREQDLNEPLNLGP